MTEPIDALRTILLESGRGAATIAAFLNARGVTLDGEPWTVEKVREMRRVLTGGRGPSKPFADVQRLKPKRKGKGAKRLRLLKRD